MKFNVSSGEVAMDIDTSSTDEPAGCIYRVAFRVGDVEENKKPKILSVGPYHYRKLATMEDYKRRLLQRVLNRNSHQTLTLQSLKVAMNDLESKTRNCYSDDFEINIKSDEFVTMMILDGCFVVELLRMTAEFRQGQPIMDKIFETRWMLHFLRRDLLVQENQLPLFVLQTIFDLTSYGQEDERSLTELTLQFFEPLRPGSSKRSIRPMADNCLHLLALFHSSFLPDCNPNNQNQQRNADQFNQPSISVPTQDWVPNAKSLRSAGLTLKKNSKNLLIKLKGKKLRIPTLSTDENTRFVLENFLAYEQSSLQVEPYFSALVAFFSNIIKSAKDVEMLQRNGIINERAKTSNELQVIYFFENLSKDVMFDPNNCYISKQVKDINKHCRTLSAKFNTIFSRAFGKISTRDIVITCISMFLYYIIDHFFQN